MTNHDSPERPQRAEPRPASEGADLGGKEEPGSAPGSTGADRRPASDRRADASATARPAADAGTADAPPPSGAFADEEDEWRHEPRESVDENPLKSFGKAVGDALTGSVDDAGPRAKPPR